MKLFYVYGSGLGHLNRVLSYIRVKKIEYSTCIIITNSKYKEFLPKEIKVWYYLDSFFKNEKLFFENILQCIDDYKINELVVDVFPCGFYGELVGLSKVSIKKTILCRILKTSYFKRFNSPYYDTLVILEKGIDFECYNYKKVEYLSICDGFEYSYKEQVIQSPFFLILHSGPKEEVVQLYKFAKMYRQKNEHIYIQTYTDISDFIEDETTMILKEKPILPLLEGARKVFTACGFNTFFATRNYHHKQHFLPFKRRFDDQFKRKNSNPLQ